MTGGACFCLTPSRALCWDPPVRTLAKTVHLSALSNQAMAGDLDSFLRESHGYHFNRTTHRLGQQGPGKVTVEE